MDNVREKLLQFIVAEREYQQLVWDDEFDDENTIHDWVAYMVSSLGKICTKEEDKELELIKIAALALAALEASTRNNGFSWHHVYDDSQD